MDIWTILLTYGGLVISFSALLISTLSYYFAILSWRETNRPIITTKIKTVRSGNTATALDLEVSNTGNRPAKNIQLSANFDYLINFLAENQNNTLPESIQRCFSAEGVIPVLENGCSVTNSFGTIGIDKPIWKVGQRIDIQVSYEDLDGRKFSHTIPILIASSDGFAGSFWKKN